MEYSATEIYKWISTILIMIFFMTIGVVLYHDNQINSFQQQASEILQRDGGLTSDAQSRITSLSNDNYNNYFTVTTTDGKTTGSTQGYGNDINYVVHTKIPIKGGFQVAQHQYSTVSKVRQDSQ